MADHFHHEPLNLTPVMPPTVFRWLLVLAAVSFSAIWSIDVSSGIISSFDAAAYPICVSSFLVTLALSFILKRQLTVLHFVTYATVAGYLISTSAWHHLAENGIFSNSTQWLGLNYVVAYLFLDVRKAGAATIVVFITTLGAHFAALIQHNTLNEALGVVANIAVANIIYMALLWTVLKMRVNGEIIQQKAQAMEEHALFDPLTRIRNRRSLEREMDAADQRWHRKGERYSILIIDIDHFKQINDLHGHMEGDQVLRDFADTLTKQLQSNQFFGRWGGEEFIILSRMDSQKDVFQLAQHLRETVERMQLRQMMKITISIGMSHCEEASNLVQAMTIADHNLYAAKHSGRNKVMDSQAAEALTRIRQEPSPT
ncbi:GGDEF domain-containing protein [Marinomonas piezotolerans]|uniref:diguanylate cyclase n=1 Tax=Marinomonas piezotolerans TaxID=2213058 RepID=A0A370U5M6_9GAMM|nr:GGDEF domain-containing protein [Marinomonas piezotolerans]RDL43087.1 GGDEF domain-containing protein [Marinomonas piezotolerans]